MAHFCVEQDIEEAVFFVDGVDGQRRLPERRQAWREALQVVKTEMDAAGIVSSLNPWYTLLHTDRGRHRTAPPLPP